MKTKKYWRRRALAAERKLGLKEQVLDQSNRSKDYLEWVKDLRAKWCRLMGDPDWYENHPGVER